MRKYKNEKTLEIEQVVCNMCGKNLKIKDGVIQEGVFHAEIPWGYFSHKDGERHTLDLCEECYDKWIQTFAVKITLRDDTELL